MLRQKVHLSAYDPRGFSVFSYMYEPILHSLLFSLSPFLEKARLDLLVTQCLINFCMRGEIGC